jgi:hypothetical protein
MSPAGGRVRGYGECSKLTHRNRLDCDVNGQALPLSKDSIIVIPGQSLWGEGHATAGAPVGYLKSPTG